MPFHSNSIFFCQSPRDVVYLLEFLDLDTDDEKIVIVTGTKEIYNFIESKFFPMTKVAFLPQLPHTPKNILKMYFRNLFFFERHLKHKNWSVVHFFSNYFDSTTFFFIARLKTKNIVFNDHFDFLRSKYNGTVSFKKRILLKLIAYISKTDCYYSGKEQILTFSIDTPSLTKVNPKISSEIVAKYSVKLHQSGQNVLLYDSNDEKELGISNYRHVVSDIVNHLKHNGFRVYVKGHPRTGLSKVFEGLNIEMINSSIPAELIDTKYIKIIIGAQTAALASASERDDLKILSFLRLLNYSEPSQKEKFENYLSSLSNGKIKFISKIKDI